MQSSLGQYQEVQQSGDEPFVLQNPKLLKATVSGSTVQVKTGSVVAHQGDLSFGTRKAFSGEGVDLMGVTGSRDAFLTGNGQEIRLVRLEGDAITCDGDNVLAFEQQMEWDINMVRGFGGPLAGGWANMTLAGTGGDTVGYMGEGLVLVQPAERALRGGS